MTANIEEDVLRDEDESSRHKPSMNSVERAARATNQQWQHMKQVMLHSLP
jgi:hypothetical protein